MIKKTTDMMLKNVEEDTSKEWIECSVQVGWTGGIPYNERNPDKPLEDKLNFLLCQTSAVTARNMLLEDIVKIVFPRI